MKRILLIVSMLVLPSTALAFGEADPDEPAPIDEENIGPWDHFDMSMGFMTGRRGYDRTRFSLHEDSLSLGIDPALDADPLRAVHVSGLRYEMRQVVSYLRMSAALDIPFPSYGAVDQPVTVRDLSPWELRFGLGAEYPVGAIAPYVDLIGSVHWIDTTLADGDVEADYEATDFSFSVRAGFRLHVRRWFFTTASAEVGLTGPTRWSAELSIGVAIL